MDRYPWSFDSIHSHCHHDVNIFLFQFLILGYRRTSAVRPARYEKTGSTRTSPTAKIGAKSLIVSEKNFFNPRAPMQWIGSFWPKISPNVAFRQASLIWYSRKKACCSILLKESNYRPDRVCMDCTVNNLLKLWVCKLSFLKRHPSIQKSKILKHRALLQ